MYDKTKCISPRIWNSKNFFLLDLFLKGWTENRETYLLKLINCPIKGQSSVISNKIVNHIENTLRGLSGVFMLEFYCWKGS